MLADQRSLFDIPDSIVCLNCAYTSPLLKGTPSRGRKGPKSFTAGQ
jgi:hypothetical protein